MPTILQRNWANVMDSPQKHSKIIHHDSPVNTCESNVSALGGASIISSVATEGNGDVSSLITSSLSSTTSHNVRRHNPYGPRVLESVSSGATYEMMWEGAFLTNEADALMEHSATTSHADFICSSPSSPTLSSPTTVGPYRTHPAVHSGSQVLNDRNQWPRASNRRPRFNEQCFVLNTFGQMVPPGEVSEKELESPFVFVKGHANVITTVCFPEEMVVVRDAHTPLSVESMPWDATHRGLLFRHVVHHKCRTVSVVGQSAMIIGQIVVVEGDHGVDVGQVVSVDNGILPSAIHTGKRRCQQILRLFRPATADEQQHYISLEAVEFRILTLLRCLSAAARQHVEIQDPLFAAAWQDIVHMEFTDVELQADHRKLYVYYRSSSHSTEPRFLNLAKALYKIFAHRIWFHRVDCATPSCSVNTSMEDAGAPRQQP